MEENYVLNKYCGILRMMQAYSTISLPLQMALIAL